MIKKTTEQFISESRLIHGEIYDYSKTVYRSLHDDLIIICPKHGEFVVNAGFHIRSRKAGKSIWNAGGCPNCKKQNKTRTSTLKSTEQFILEARNIHGELYDYTKTIYTGANNKIVVICRIHGEFSVYASQHIKKMAKINWNPCGCPKCGLQKTIDRNKIGKKSPEFFEMKARLIHGDRYQYFGDYTGSNKKVKIHCQKHGYFFQIASNHYRGSGCPSCKNSKGCLQIENILNKHGYFFIKEYKFDDCRGDHLPLLFDFFLPEQNIVIEYDGEQHFRPIKFHKKMIEDKTIQMFEKVKKYDNIKNEYCFANDIKMIRISYKDVKIAEEIIYTALLIQK
jgi:hypothetical protein